MASEERAGVGSRGPGTAASGARSEPTPRREAAGAAPGPGAVISPYLPQPGQHVGRRIIKVEDTPAHYWLDSARSAGTSWAEHLGIEKAEIGVWEVRSPETLTSRWFAARTRVKVRRDTPALRRAEVALTADAKEVQATTGSLRNWAQGRAGTTLRQWGFSTATAPDSRAARTFAVPATEGGGGPAAARPVSSTEVDAVLAFQHSVQRLEEGVLMLPASTWGGGLTHVEIDVEASPRPSLFLIQVIGISSFLGDYGLGRTVKTMSLLPGETMTMSLRTWRASQETIAQGSSIIDSYDESSSERFAETVLSETTDTATREKSENWYAEAEAKASIGIASASVSGGGGGEYSSSTEEFSRSVDESVRDHAQEASSHRENAVTSSSERTVSTEDEQVIERTIKNINVKRTLNFTIRDLNQAYITKTHLMDVRIAFSNGNPGTWREEPLSGLRRLVSEVIAPEFVDEVCRDLLKTIAVVQDVHGSPVNVLEQVLLDRCATDFVFRDAQPGDDCAYPAPTGDGRLYYRFKRGPLGQAPDEPHPVEGVLLKQREIVMKTDSVVAEALLGSQDALDQYSAALQTETIREKTLASDREQLAQRIVAARDSEAAELFAKVFATAPAADEEAPA